jgi:HEAT repeat protein/lysophospholipase L1-like esterase
MGRGGQRLLPNVLLSLAVLALLLGALEGGSRLLERLRPAPEMAAYLWDWEERWDGDFYTVGPPGSGWPPWEDFNADGVRDRAHPVERLPGAWRVAFLGDSVTMGAGIEPKDAYPQVLESLLKAEGRGIEVFNFALWGWSTRQQRIAYDRLADKYRPDLVVLAVCLNDVPELQNNLTRPPRWLAALHERLALVRRVVNAPGREIQSVEQLFAQPEPAKVREAWERFFEEVRRLAADVRKDGAALAVLVFPFRFQVLPDAPAPLAQQRLAAFCSAEGLRCLDLLPAIQAVGESAFIDYDHLSPVGTRATADAILASGLLPAEPSYPRTLIEALQVLSSPDAWAAVRWAERPDFSDPLVVQGLLRALNTSDEALRAAGAWGLARLGPPAHPARNLLVRALKEDPSAAVRAEAARALGSLGAAANRPAVPALFDALADTSETVRWRAAQALSKAGLAAPADVPRLVATLESPDPYVRAFAAWTLGDQGAAAKDAVPALIAALEKEEEFHRGGPALALAKMGAVAKEAVPALVDGLKSPDHQRRRNSAKALGRIGPDARGAVPYLVSALQDDDQRVRAQVARALGRIGNAAEEAIPALTVATQDPEPSVRREAEDALRRIRKSG